MTAAGAGVPTGEDVGTRTCVTCKHWQHPRNDFVDVVEQDPDSDGWMTNEPDARDMAYGQCSAVQMGPVERDDEDPLAVVMDGSQYMADLYTRAEFGCVLHEPPSEGEA